MVGFNPDKDYLIDPQQRPQSKLICGGCKRQIYFGEVFYRLFLNVSEFDICTECHAALERSASVAGEEIYV